MSLHTAIHVRSGPPDPLDEHPDLDGYRVVQGRHGTAVYGLIPVSDLLGLSKTWEEKGYTIWDAGVASALGATLCATNPEGSRAWRTEIEERAARAAGDDRELRWMLGWDTGRSSAAILLSLGWSARARKRAEVIVRRGDRGLLGAVPADPDDLGRCVRLLDLFPAWRERLPELAAADPAWTPLVRQWAELEALYRQEVPTGRCPLTHARMKALAEEAREVSETTVDLSALGFLPAWEGPYFEALDDVLGVMIDRHEELPERLYVVIPPEPGARLMMWSRGGGAATVERAVRRSLAQEGGDAE